MYLYNTNARPIIWYLSYLRTSFCIYDQCACKMKFFRAFSSEHYSRVRNPGGSISKSK